MPKNKLQKSLQEYISKIKKQTPPLQFSHSSISSVTCKILPRCKNPKSLSFSAELKGGNDHDKGDEAATLEDIDKFLFENFKTLYGQEFDHYNDTEFTHEEIRKGKQSQNKHFCKESRNLFDSSKSFTPPPDLCGSHRFFISPASSGSLIEEVGMSSSVGTYTSYGVGSSSASSGNTRAHTPDDFKSDTSTIISKGVEDCIAVLTVSTSPYGYFRRSMQEIVEARAHNNQRMDWDFLEKILFCYLKLNEKKQYRYILSAFVDLIVVLRQNSCMEDPKGHVV